jgi:hypothetical protein
VCFAPGSVRILARSCPGLMKLADQLFPCGQQLRQGNRFRGHAIECMLIVFADIAQDGEQYFMHGTIVTSQVDRRVSIGSISR